MQAELIPRRGFDLRLGRRMEGRPVELLGPLRPLERLVPLRPSEVLVPCLGCPRLAVGLAQGAVPAEGEVGRPWNGWVRCSARGGDCWRTGRTGVIGRRPAGEVLIIPCVATVIEPAVWRCNKTRV